MPDKAKGETAAAVEPMPDGEPPPAGAPVAAGAAVEPAPPGEPTPPANPARLRASDRHRHYLQRVGRQGGDLLTFSWSLEAGEVEVDPRLLAMAGLPADARPRPFEWLAGLVHPEDQEPLFREIRLALDPAGHGAMRTEVRVCLPGGEERWMAITALVTFDHAPRRAVALDGSVLDITPQRRAQAALQASEARYRSLFASMHEGFSVVQLLRDERGATLDFLVLESNAAQQAVTGGTDATGRRALDLLGVLDPTLLERLDRVAETGQGERWEQYLPQVDRWFDLHATKVDGEGGLRVALVYSDITRRKLMEAEQAKLLVQEQEARAAAEAALRVRDDFLAMVSHELRTPLAAVLLWARLLASGKAAGRESEALEVIERNAEAQRVLTEGLLDASRAISGNLAIRPVRQRLAPVIVDAIDSLTPTAEAALITLVTRLEPGVAIPVDADRLGQVVRNLLDNAIRHSPAGGVVTVTLVADPAPGGGAVLRVEDQGDGIAPDLLPHVFERFRRGFTGPDDRGVGHLGLGLALSRDIVELHGGRIQAHSDGMGAGTVITIHLPVTAPAAPTPVPPAARPKARTRP